MESFSIEFLLHLRATFHRSIFVSKIKNSLSFYHKTRTSISCGRKKFIRNVEKKCKKGAGDKAEGKWFEIDIIRHEI